MKRLLTSLAVGAVTAASLFPITGRAAASQPAASMSVAIAKVSTTTVTTKHAAVTFRLRVRGITLDAGHLGKANVRGHGHFQIYVDKIPSDAYTRKDLRKYWLAALAAPTFTLKLTPAILGGRGKHRIFVALAQNNYVLYRVPVATATLTAK